MSWYRDSDGTIIVNDLDDLVHTNITFQMGTVRRADGKLVLIDHDALYLCGKRVRRPSTRRPPHYKPAIQHVMEDVIDAYVTNELPAEDCPMDKSKCVLWNDVFKVCAAKECVRHKDEKKASHEVHDIQSAAAAPTRTRQTAIRSVAGRRRARRYAEGNIPGGPVYHP